MRDQSNLCEISLAQAKIAAEF